MCGGKEGPCCVRFLQVAILYRHLPYHTIPWLLPSTVLHRHLPYHTIPWLLPFTALHRHLPCHPIPWLLPTTALQTIYHAIPYHGCCPPQPFRHLPYHAMPWLLLPWTQPHAARVPNHTRSPQLRPVYRTIPGHHSSGPCTKPYQVTIPGHHSSGSPTNAPPPDAPQ